MRLLIVNIIAVMQLCSYAVMQLCSYAVMVYKGKLDYFDKSLHLLPFEFGKRYHDYLGL